MGRCPSARSLFNRHGSVRLSRTTVCSRWKAGRACSISMARAIEPRPKMTTTDRLRLAVFDLDGTLLDSAESIVTGVMSCWEAVGDGKYGGRDAFLPGVPDAKSLHLHARTLEIPHPRGGALRLTAPLPDSMAATWRFFGFDPMTKEDAFD